MYESAAGKLAMYKKQGTAVDYEDMHIDSSLTMEHMCKAVIEYLRHMTTISGEQRTSLQEALAASKTEPVCLLVCVPLGTDSHSTTKRNGTITAAISAHLKLPSYDFICWTYPLSLRKRDCGKLDEVSWHSDYFQKYSV